MGRFPWAVASLVVVLSSSAAAKDLTLPDLKITPGKVRELSLKKICSTKWGLDKRHVTSGMKQTAYENYGLSGPNDKQCIRDKHGRKCEVDHLIPRSLGGADDIKNLWPQPFGSQPWNASRKDRLEVKLSKETCIGNLTLKQARAMLRKDYRIAYRKYFGEP